MIRNEPGRRSKVCMNPGGGEGVSINETAAHEIQASAKGFQNRTRPAGPENMSCAE